MKDINTDGNGPCIDAKVLNDMETRVSALKENVELTQTALKVTKMIPAITVTTARAQAAEKFLEAQSKKGIYIGVDFTDALKRLATGSTVATVEPPKSAVGADGSTNK